MDERTRKALNRSQQDRNCEKGKLKPRKIGQFINSARTRESNQSVEQSQFSRQITGGGYFNIRCHCKYLGSVLPMLRLIADFACFKAHDLPGTVLIPNINAGVAITTRDVAIGGSGFDIGHRGDQGSGAIEANLAV